MPLSTLVSWVLSVSSVLFILYGWSITDQNQYVMKGLPTYCEPRGYERDDRSTDRMSSGYKTEAFWSTYPPKVMTYELKTYYLLQVGHLHSLSLAYSQIADDYCPGILLGPAAHL